MSRRTVRDAEVGEVLRSRTDPRNIRSNVARVEEVTPSGVVRVEYGTGRQFWYTRNELYTKFRFDYLQAWGSSRDWDKGNDDD